jgi:hypothetical protein
MFVNGSGQNVQSLERTAHRCFLPSFGSFGQTVSEEKNFKNRLIRNKSCLWQSCLLTDRDEISNLYRGPSIDASYQVSVHLAEGFQRRRLKCEKLTDYRRRMPSDGKSSRCLWQGELNKRRSNRADSKFNLTYNSANSVLWVRVMVFNASFNNISVILWWSVLLMEETGLPGENHRPVASHWQTLS